MDTDQTTQDQTAEDQDDAPGTPVDGDSEDKAKARATIPISVPVEFYEIVKAAAEADKVTVSALARNKLAAAFNYTLPPLTRNRAKIYATPEERRAAANKAQKERYSTANALLAAIKAGAFGDVDLNALVEKYGKKDEPKAEASAEAPAVAEAEAAPVA